MSQRLWCCIWKHVWEGIWVVEVPLRAAVVTTEVLTANDSPVWPLSIFLTQPTRASSHIHKIKLLPCTHTNTRTHTHTQTSPQGCWGCWSMCCWWATRDPSTLQHIINFSLLDRMIAQSICQSNQTPTGPFRNRAGRERVKYHTCNKYGNTHTHTHTIMCLWEAQPNYTHALWLQSNLQIHFGWLILGDGRPELNPNRDLIGRWNSSTGGLTTLKKTRCQVEHFSRHGLNMGTTIVFVLAVVVNDRAGKTGGKV